MKENEFAIFTPINDIDNENKEQLKKYYLDNNLLLDNDYLKNYLGITPTIDNITGISQSQNLDRSSITSILGNIQYNKNIQPNNSLSNAVPSTTNEDSKNRATYAINYFMKNGLTKEQAAGIVGNLHAESKFNTSILGDNKTSYGIAQWHGDRWERLKDFSNRKKVPIDSFQTQLDFLWDELQTTEFNALSELKKTKTPAEAARVFANKFERMAKYNVLREQMANQYYKN